MKKQKQKQKGKIHILKTKLPEKWNIPESLQSRFGSKGIGKQRAMSADGHLLLILHKLNERNETEAVIFWRNPKGEWLDSQKGRGIFKLRSLIEEYMSKELELSALYDKSSAPENYFDLLEMLAPLVRVSKNMANTLQQARELEGGPDIIDLRDLTQELAQDLDVLYEDAKNGLDYTVAKRTEEQAKYSLRTSRSSDKLNVLVAIFLPITALSGIFGMNVRNGLEEMPSFAFWIMMVISFVVGLGIKSWILADGEGDSSKVS